MTSTVSRAARAGWRRALVALGLITMGAGSAAAAPSPLPAAPTASPAADPDEKDVVGKMRLSLPTEADRDAWLRDGFRLGLGFHMGEMFGVGGPPGARVTGVTLQVGLRLDADWSVFATFQYGVMTRGISGLRFSGTIDPTWHVTRHLSLALGLGFGGISGGSTGRADIAPLPGTLTSSYTFPTADPPLPSCTGEGVAALARATWAIVLGARSSFTASVESFGQWTGCTDETGLVEPDTGQAIVRRQFWPHVGVTGTLGFVWR